MRAGVSISRTDQTCHDLSSCRDCASGHIEKEEDKGRIPKCPECDRPYKARDLRESRQNTTGNLKLGKSSSLQKVDFQTSTKLNALINKLKEIAQQDPLYKALIFSQVSSSPNYNAKPNP